MHFPSPAKEYLSSSCIVSCIAYFILFWFYSFQTSSDNPFLEWESKISLGLPTLWFVKKNGLTRSTSIHLSIQPKFKKRKQCRELWACWGEKKKTNTQWAVHICAFDIPIHSNMGIYSVSNSKPFPLFALTGYVFNGSSNHTTTITTTTRTRNPAKRNSTPWMDGWMDGTTSRNDWNPKPSEEQNQAHKITHDRGASNVPFPY